MAGLSEAETPAETAERPLHGSSFGAAASAYAEHRPGYAEAAVRWALEPVHVLAAGGRPPGDRRQGGDCPSPLSPPWPPRRVVDLGAGTGKLTETLVRLGVEVTAVEPDPGMLGELRRELPSVRSLTGSAEVIGTLHDPRPRSS